MDQVLNWLAHTAPPLGGFVTWWGTGFDDLALLIVILQKCERRQRWFVLLGQCIGVMIILAAAFGVTLIAIPGWLTSVISGSILTFVGIKMLKGDEENAEETLISNRATAFLAGLSIYLANSLDDLGALTAFFIQMPRFSCELMALGFFLGWIAMAIAAWKSRDVEKKWIRWVLQRIPYLLIAGGLGVLSMGIYKALSSLFT